MGRDLPSLIQPGPDSKFDVPPLDVTLRRFFSLHVASLRFFSRMFGAIFCNFDGFRLPKRRVLETDVL